MGHCRIVDLRGKEVINICDGCRLGFPCDVELDVVCGKIVSIIVQGSTRMFSLFGRCEEYIVPWDAIRRIGEDIILVEFDRPIHPPPREKRRW